MYSMILFDDRIDDTVSIANKCIRFIIHNSVSFLRLRTLYVIIRIQDCPKVVLGFIVTTNLNRTSNNKAELQSNTEEDAGFSIRTKFINYLE